MFVVGGFEKFGGALLADDGCASEDVWRMARGCQASCYFGLDAVDEHATADG